MMKKIFVLAVVALAGIWGKAQSSLEPAVNQRDMPMSETIPERSGTSRNPATGKQTQKAAEPLPTAFGSVSLGMSVDAVREALKKDTRFGFRGNRDVSLLAGDNRVLIETDAARYSSSPFLDRCWFQFYEDKLYIMTITMNQDKLDHYSVFSQLCEKYGNPTTLNPEKSEWVGDNVIVDLERPLSIKYTDRATFEKLQSASLVDKTAAEKNRDAFLQGL